MRLQETETHIFSIHSPPVSDEWIDYTQHVAGLLEGRLHYHDSPTDRAIREAAVRDSDVILIHQPPRTWCQQALERAPRERRVTTGPASTLFSWPGSPAGPGASTFPLRLCNNMFDRQMLSSYLTWSVRQVMMPKRKRIVALLERPLTDEWEAFTHHVAHLVGAIPVFRHPPSHGAWNNVDWLRQATEGAKLVLVQAPEVSWIQRILGRSPMRRLIAQADAPVLVARRPRQPFRRLLLALRDEPPDRAAISWALHLAETSVAEITILPVVPSLPILYRMGSSSQPELAVLLAPNTPIGRSVRQVVTAMAEAEIPGAVRQQRGPPVWQIRREMAEGNHDLLVIGVESGGRFYRWFVGALVPPLLRWNDFPILIVRTAEGA